MSEETFSAAGDPLAELKNLAEPYSYCTGYQAELLNGGHHEEGKVFVISGEIGLLIDLKRENRCLETIARELAAAAERGLSLKVYADEITGHKLYSRVAELSQRTSYGKTTNEAFRQTLTGEQSNGQDNQSTLW